MNDRKESPNASTPVTLLAALLCKGLRRGEGGERSEPGEGRSDFQFELREPLTPPSPLRGEGDQPPCQIKCDSPASSGRGTRCGKRRAPRTIAELSVIFS